MLPSFRATGSLKQVNCETLLNMFYFSIIKELLSSSLEGKVSGLRLWAAGSSGRFSETVSYTWGTSERWHCKCKKDSSLSSLVVCELNLGPFGQQSRKENENCPFPPFLLGLVNFHYLWGPNSKNFPPKSWSELVVLFSGIP